VSAQVTLTEERILYDDKGVVKARLFYFDIGVDGRFLCSLTFDDKQKTTEPLSISSRTSASDLIEIGKAVRDIISERTIADKI